jgi:hypothetical protein
MSATPVIYIIHVQITKRFAQQWIKKHLFLAVAYHLKRFINLSHFCLDIDRIFIVLFSGASGI